MTQAALAAFLSLIIVGCSANTADENSHIPADQTNLAGLETAYFASGCFWCVEAVFESVNGVKEAVSGYAGGHTSDPTYRSIGTGATGHAESVAVYYDPKVVTYSTLVDVFFASQDPTTLNRQGPDGGSQYRSIAFYQNASEQKIIVDRIAELNASGEYGSPIVTEVVPFEKFYEAEEYHQNYERLNPNEPYVRSVSIPRLERFKKKMPEVLR